MVYGICGEQNFFFFFFFFFDLGIWGFGDLEGGRRKGIVKNPPLHTRCLSSPTVRAVRSKLCKTRFLLVRKGKDLIMRMVRAASATIVC